MINSEESLKLKSKYNPEGSELRRIQLRLLEVLEYIDNICRKNNIRYWLSSGTLLGAIRHDGFIPWDDDVDIEIWWEDYDRFCSVVTADNSPRFCLQTSKNDIEYPNVFDRIVDTNSRVYQYTMLNSKYKYDGIAVDIFSIGPSFNKSIEKTLSLIQYYGVFSLCRIHNSQLRRFLLRISKFVIHDLVFKIISKYRKRRKVLSPNMGSDYYYPFEYSTFFPLKECIFEGKTFFAPNDIQKYLVTMYGDNYNELPEENIRNIFPKQVIKL